jgi:hypothetical protein
MTTRGIRNNNPGNIERGAKWQGLAAKHEMTPPQKREKRFCVFRSPEWGIRALVKIIQTYERKHSLDTVRGIIERWAPPVENDTSSYITQVAKALDVEQDEPLNLANTHTMLVLAKAIIAHENGSQPYGDATIRAAIALAGVKASKPKPLLASKRLKGGALVGGATTVLVQSQAVVETARKTVAAIVPEAVQVDSGWGLALVLGAAFAAFGVYIGWTIWMDYRDRYEPDEIAA